MNKEYTAIIERRYRGWYIAHCVEIPGATGQGPTEEDAQKSLQEAISLVLRDQFGLAPEPEEAGTELVH